MNVTLDPAFGLIRFGHQLTFGLLADGLGPAAVQPVETHSLDVGTARVQGIQAATCRVHSLDVAVVPVFGQQSS